MPTTALPIDFIEEFKNTAYPFTDEKGYKLSNGASLPVDLFFDCCIYTTYTGPLYLTKLNVTEKQIQFYFSNISAADILSFVVSDSSIYDEIAEIYDKIGNLSGIIYFNVKSMFSIFSFASGTYNIPKENLTLVPSCYQTMVLDKTNSITIDNQKLTGDIEIYGSESVIFQQSTDETTNTTTVTVNIINELLNNYKPIEKNGVTIGYVQPAILKEVVISDNANIIPITPNENDEAGRILISDGTFNNGNRLKITSNSNQIKIKAIV